MAWPTPLKILNPDNLLLKDYIATLKETEQGLLLIGFWQADYEIRDPTHDQRLANGPADYVSSMQFTPKHQLLIGSYGSGLQTVALPPSLFGSSSAPSAVAHP